MEVHFPTSYLFQRVGVCCDLLVARSCVVFQVRVGSSALWRNKLMRVFMSVLFAIGVRVRLVRFMGEGAPKQPTIYVTVFMLGFRGFVGW